MTKPLRVAIYARVSTDDKEQNPENQLRQLREWCANSGHEIVAEYIEYESGRKAASKRPKLDALLNDAGKRKFDLVLVWALDRLSREGMMATVAYIQRLTGYGVGLHSYTEPLISTDNELVRDIVIAVMSSLAKAEAQRLSLRVKAGMDRARLSGKHVGRPRLDPAKVEAARAELTKGTGVRAVAELVGLSTGSVSGIKATMTV